MQNICANIAISLKITGILLVLSFFLLVSCGVSAQKVSYLSVRTGTSTSTEREMYRYKATLGIPDMPRFGARWAFGSSWIDPTTEHYYLSDLQDKRIDVIDLARHEDVDAIQLTGWRGSETKGTEPAAGGLVGNAHGIIYAGDGDGSVKVFDAQSQRLLGEVFTKGKGPVGKLAYDPERQVLLAVNGSDSVPFVALINVSDPHHPVLLASLPFPGARLDTPLWDGQEHRFLLSVTETSGKQERGEIAALIPTGTGLLRHAGIPVPCAPGGIALGPREQMLVGCAQGHPYQIDARSGTVVTSFPQVSGSIGEISLDGRDGCFYLAATGNTPVVGVIDVIPNRSSFQWITNIPTTAFAYDVAVDSATDVVYIPANGLTKAGYAYQGIAVFSKNWYNGPIN